MVEEELNPVVPEEPEGNGQVIDDDGDYVVIADYDGSLVDDDKDKDEEPPATPPVAPEPARVPYSEPEPVPKEAPDPFYDEEDDVTDYERRIIEKAKSEMDTVMAPAYEIAARQALDAAIASHPESVQAIVVESFKKDLAGLTPAQKREVASNPAAVQSYADRIAIGWYQAQFQQKPPEIKGNPSAPVAGDPAQTIRIPKVYEAEWRTELAAAKFEGKDIKDKKVALEIAKQFVKEKGL